MYKLAPEPSTHRVAIWRMLKRAGAVYVQSSVCLLPDTPEAVKKLESTRRNIEDLGGWCSVFRAGGLDASDDERIVSEFNSAREKEYAELVDRCQKFIQEIEEETARGNFTYAEIEENEDDLKKLRRWFLKVQARDFFGCPVQGEAARILAECGQRLAKFAQEVYRREIGEGNHA